MSRGTRIGGLALGLLVMVTPRSKATEEDSIQQAIARGVQCLKQIQLNRDQFGALVLRGLTLLECGVPANDPIVEQIAKEIRKQGPIIADTYSLAVAIMMLDRLGERSDVPLLQTMAARLLGGQNVAGGWGYPCPPLTEEEARRLLAFLRTRNELRGGVALPKSSKPTDGPPPGVAPPAPGERVDPLRAQQAQRAQKAFNEIGDNSNTQFAILALWIANRHDVPIRKAIEAVAARFRASQRADGGWSYRGESADSSTATMTCAGLLGLAMSHGIANEDALKADKKPRAPLKDSAIVAGFSLLNPVIGQPVLRTGGKPLVIPRGAGNHVYYLFWSLERVAVVYDLKSIGGKDWYAWGSEVLLASQQTDGSWIGEFGPQIDTCFALLFLKKANLAPDLTARLRGKLQDPGEVTLKSGGVGGAGLPQKSGKPSGGAKDRPAADQKGRDSELLPPRPNSSARDEPREAEVDPQAARLAKDLVKATVVKQEKIIDQYKKSTGAVYTQALAVAIPDLLGPLQTRGREALAERLMRMTVATRRDHLQAANPEIRYAAARACVSPEDKANVPDLIELLEDPVAKVGRAARTALKHLTKEDFGPQDSSPVERARAVAQWKKWWKERGSTRR